MIYLFNYHLAVVIPPSTVTCQPATGTVPQRLLPDQQPLNFSEDEHLGISIYVAINSCYIEVVHWKPNIFLVPFGSAGTSFVIEVARLFQLFADSSLLEHVSMRAITRIKIILLQKPSKRSKTEDHISYIKRRLHLSSNVDIQQLLKEGRSIQSQVLFRLAPGKNDAVGHIFRSLMAQGKVQSVLALYLSRRERWSSRSG